MVRVNASGVRMRRSCLLGERRSSLLLALRRWRPEPITAGRSQPYRCSAGGALAGSVEDPETGDGILGIDRGRPAASERLGQPGIEELVRPRLGLDLAEVAVDAQPAPALPWLAAPPRLRRAPACPQRLLLDVKAVLDIGAARTEHPQPGPDLGGEHTRPQVRAHPARVLERDEHVDVAFDACPTPVDLGVDAAWRPEQQQRLVHQVTAEIQ